MQKNWTRLLLACALALAAFFPKIFAQNPHVWHRTNPGGGGAFAAIGASASGLIVVGSDLSGAYRSSDGGASWQPLGARQGLTATHVSALAFHPTVGSYFYLGTDQGIFRSWDSGDTFHQTLFDGYISAIEVSEADPWRVFAARQPAWNEAKGEIFRSDDGGATWAQASDLPDDFYIDKIVASPTDPNVVFIVTGRGRWACGPARALKSADGGATWTDVSPDAAAVVLDLEIDALDASRLFLTTQHADCAAQWYWTDTGGAFFASQDGGATWSQRAERTGLLFLKKGAPQTVRLIDPRTSYAPTSGTWESIDGGFFWQKIGAVEDWGTAFIPGIWAYSESFNGPVATMGGDLSDSDNFFWCTTQWVFGSFDGGQQFDALHSKPVAGGNRWQSTGADNIVAQKVVVSPADPNVVYAGFWDIGLWRSLDRGASWEACNDSAHTGAWLGYGGNTLAVAADPTRPGVVWAVLQGNQNERPFLLKNEKFGEKSAWQNAFAGLPEVGPVFGLSVDPSSPTEARRLFVTVAGDVYRSLDDGATWSLALADGGLFFTAISPDGAAVFAGGSSGVRRSLDGGATWQDIGLPEMAAPAKLDPRDWGYAGAHDLAVAPSDPQLVFAAILGAGRGIFKSSNRGETWQKILTDDFARAVRVSPKSSDLIYAGSSSAYFAGGWNAGSRGLLFSKNGGATWDDADPTGAWPFGFSLDIDAAQPERVWAVVAGTGVQWAETALGPVPSSEANGGGGSAFFSVAPNPSDGRFSATIRLARATTVEVEIFDALGRRVARAGREAEAGEAVFFFDLNEKRPLGPLFLQARDADGRFLAAARAAFF